MGLQLRTSALLAAQYRWDFLVDGGLSLFWASTAIVPLFVVYSGDRTPGIPGWSFGEALVVTGWFILLQGVLDGAINPGLQAVIDHIRKGTLDFVLLKPADAQFLVSTSRFQLWRVSSLLSALAVFVIAFARLGSSPSPKGVLMSLVLLVTATVLLYSLWILIVCGGLLRGEGRQPHLPLRLDLRRGAMAVVGVSRGAEAVFTFVVPLTVMTTYPAEALLGRLELSTLAASIAGSAVFALAARGVWLRSVGHYTSAGG